MDILPTAAIVGSSALLGLYWLRQKLTSSREEPPSVGRYPLVGSFFHLQEPIYLSLYEKFGQLPIVRVHFGTQCIYVFNKWSPFKEAMVDNSEQLSGRQQQHLLVRLVGEQGGIVLSDGDIWREYRRFTLKTLRDFGFGRQGVEEIIVGEAEHMLSSLATAGENPVETMMLMSTATSNVICQLVFGSRLASEDPRFGEMLDLFRRITQNSSSNLTRCIFMTTMPIVKYLPLLMSLVLKLPSSRAVVENFEKLRAYCNEQRDRHAAEIDKVAQARDYIEAHMLHQRQQSGVFTDTRLTLAVGDLFIAGTDTTANTLRWAILFLIANPGVADAMHREIVEQIGRERLPRMQDKARLHYTQAVIEEVHRRASLVPLGVFHRVTEDTDIGGCCRLKANSLCTFNVYSIHHDPELFPEPNRFLPERHLRDGQFVPCPHLAAFGLGKRACLGESLARMELFIFLSALVQKYRFGLDPQDSRSLWQLTEDPSFSKGTLLRAPPLHKIVFTPRV